MVELALPFAPLRIEHHEYDAASLPCWLPARVALRRHRESLRPCSSHRAIDALPEAVVARAQIEDGAVIRIDGQPFPVAAAVFIAAKLEGHVGVLKGLAGRRNAVWRHPAWWIGIGAAGKIHAIGIGRVDGDAFDAHPVEVFVRHPVEQRFPAMGEIVPAVSAADIVRA